MYVGQILRSIFRPRASLSWRTASDSVQNAGKTHRELFSDFYADLMREPLEQTLAENPRPFWSVALFGQMMRDLHQCGGRTDPIEQVSCILLPTDLICREMAAHLYLDSIRHDSWPSLCRPVLEEDPLRDSACQHQNIYFYSLSRLAVAHPFSKVVACCITLNLPPFT